MRRVLAIVMAAGLAGCGWGQGTKQRAANGGSAAKTTKVFVAYHGPEQATRRFRRLFEIAADDYGVTIADNASGADALMNVTITEEGVEEHINARVLRAGFVLQEGKTATVENCLGTSNGEGPDSPITYTGIAAELKKRYPSVMKVFVDPIKGNVEPHVSEIVKKELLEEKYVLAANRAQADAVLRAIGITQEQIPMEATRHHIGFTISGAVTVKSESSPVIYKAIKQPFPERARACLSGMQGWVYPNSINGSDAFWSNAASAAKDLAKPQEDHSKKD